MENCDIVFVASCNVDLVSYVKRMPIMGETLMGDSFKMGFGGKGANKAIACSRLGSNCTVISKLGNDIFGRDYLDNFKKNNVKTDFVFTTEEAATGVAPIVVDENGNNSILVVLGANLLLNENDIDSCNSLIKNSKFLVTNLEIPVKTALHSLKLAKSNNVVTILNFAPATSEFDKELFSSTDYLILNEVEIEQLTHLPSETIEQVKTACYDLLSKYGINKGIIVTLGGNGVLFVNSTTKIATHQTSQAVKVIDTSGAGDAFVGSFVHYLNKLGPESMDKVLELASGYATLTVQSRGTQSSYPYLTNLEDKYKIN